MLSKKMVIAVAAGCVAAGPTGLTGAVAADGSLINNYPFVRVVTLGAYASDLMSAVFLISVVMVWSWRCRWVS